MSTPTPPSNRRERSFWAVQPWWASTLSGLIVAAGLLGYAYVPLPTWPAACLFGIVICLTALSRVAGRAPSREPSAMRRALIMAHGAVILCLMAATFMVCQRVADGDTQSTGLAWLFGGATFAVMAAASWDDISDRRVTDTRG